MELAGVLRNASVVALLCMLVPVLALAMSVTYAIWPDERRLALMRPLSLAAIFAALCGVSIGTVTILRGITATMSADSWRLVALGASEAVVPLFVTFGSLTVAWLLVALGMRRSAAGR